MTTAKRLLVAGGGYADVPLIQAAKTLGFHVITSGNRPEDIGHNYSDECQLEDFSDREAMLRLARGLGIDAICACCNDFSALSAAYVAEQMGLPGHDSVAITETLHHKDRFRLLMQQHGLSSPRAIGVSSLNDSDHALRYLRFPVIIKPVDLTGGKGISVAEDGNAARKAIQAALATSRAKRVVVEEFLSGSRHGFSSFVRSGRVVFFFHDNEHYYTNPYLVSAASTPSTAPACAVEKLIAEVERLSSILQLSDGLMHVQYVLHNDEPVIIEICRRAPGDLYTQFVKIATGVDYPSYIVRAQAGMDCSDVNRKDVTGFYTRHCVMTDRCGAVRDIHFDAEIKHHVVDSFMWWQVGDRIVDPLTQKLGIVFLRFDSMDQMLDLTERMQQLIRVDLDSAELGSAGLA